jgi:sugar phosphate isomerase/epimerase
VAPFTDTIDVAAAGASLAAICERLDRYGCEVAFEFLPFTGVRDVDQALALFAAAGDPPNAGLCVDSWHVFRGAGLGQLDGLDPARVNVVQFDDGPLEPVLDDYLQDTLHHRCLPGDGQFDLVAFLRALPADVPLSVEVIDDDLDALPTADAVARIGDATRKLLAAAA